MGASENVKLELNIAATIKFSFGTICDKVQSYLQNGDGLAREIVDLIATNPKWNRSELHAKIKETVENHAQKSIAVLQREARNQGNDALRIIINHLQHVKVLRRHKSDKINVARIAERHGRGNEDGS